MKFQNPHTQEIVEIKSPASAVLFLGPLYFIYRRIWLHAVLSAILFYYSWGFSNIAYAYFATDIVRAHYENAGWKRVGVPDSGIEDKKGV